MRAGFFIYCIIIFWTKKDHSLRSPVSGVLHKVIITGVGFGGEFTILNTKNNTLVKICPMSKVYSNG